MSAGKTPRGEDGQHYSNDYYNPGVESGQKAVIPMDYRVGQSSGGEQAMSVPIVHRGTDHRKE